MPVVPLPESLVYEGTFEHISAISEIERHLDELDCDLYLSLNDAADAYEESY